MSYVRVCMFMFSRMATRFLRNNQRDPAVLLHYCMKTGFFLSTNALL